MGTFVCYPSSATLTGDTAWQILPSGTFLDALGSGVNPTARKDTPYDLDQVFGFHASPDFTQIALDGGAPIDYSSLPAGFHVDSVVVNVKMPFGSNNTAGGRIMYLQWLQSNLGAALDNSDFAFGNTTAQRVVDPTPSTIGTFFATNFGFSTETGGGAGLVTFDVSEAYISGTYSIQNYQWYVNDEEDEHDGVPFTRDVLTQVFDGDEPPENAEPLGPPDIDPTFYWWEFDDIDIILYLYQPTSPGTGWTQVVAPQNYGWWKSFEEFQGGALLIVNGNPKKPRTYEQISDYSNFMGGFPGCGTVWNHKLVYAGRDYTEPVVRIFDGLSDREVARIPDYNGSDSTAIISMATVNGTIYLTSLDSGSTDTTYVGRVWSLDVASGQLTLIGAAFTGGDLPYAIAWHNGKLWCGTNPAGDGDEGGKIYHFLPGVDTVWTLDHDLDTELLGGCTGLVSFQGKLIATTVTNATDSAQVLARGIDGTWANVTSGSGTAALNAFQSPVVYNDTLYFSYWDSTDGAFVYSYDGTTVTEVLESDYSDRPFIGLYLASGNIYALGGGLGETAILYGSEDGSSWDDLTTFLPGIDDELATPVFAEVRNG